MLHCKTGLEYARTVQKIVLFILNALLLVPLFAQSLTDWPGLLICAGLLAIAAGIYIFSGKSLPAAGMLPGCIVLDLAVLVVLKRDVLFQVQNFGAFFHRLIQPVPAFHYLRFFIIMATILLLSFSSAMITAACCNILILMPLLTLFRTAGPPGLTVSAEGIYILMYLFAFLILWFLLAVICDDLDCDRQFFVAQILLICILFCLYQFRAEWILENSAEVCAFLHKTDGIFFAPNHQLWLFLALIWLTVLMYQRVYFSSPSSAPSADLPMDGTCMLILTVAAAGFAISRWVLFYYGIPLFLGILILAYLLLGKKKSRKQPFSLSPDLLILLLIPYHLILAVLLSRGFWTGALAAAAAPWILLSYFQHKGGVQQAARKGSLWSAAGFALLLICTLCLCQISFSTVKLIEVAAASSVSMTVLAFLEGGRPASVKFRRCGQILVMLAVPVILWLLPPNAPVIALTADNSCVQVTVTPEENSTPMKSVTCTFRNAYGKQLSAESVPVSGGSLEVPENAVMLTVTAANEEGQTTTRTFFQKHLISFEELENLDSCTFFGNWGK